MPFNGSGVFQRLRNWVADAAAGIKIRADYHDAEDDGFAAGLTNCITKDGQTIVTQNIPWNSKRITGLEDPVNPQDAATKAYTDTKMPLAGGTLTGDLTISKDGPLIHLNDTDASHMGISTTRANKQRWLLRLGNGEPETGDNNAGSNFDINRYADDGAHLGMALYFSRASGLGSVVGDPITPLGIATKQYSDAGTSNKVLRAGDNMTGLLASAPGGPLTDTSGVGTFIALSGEGNTASMSFHIPSVFGANFGMNAVGDFYMGGWSHGATAYKFWTTKDFAALPSGGVTNARLAYAGDVAASTGPQSSPYEPYAGGVLTGWQWAIVSTATVTAFRIRYMQLYTTSWFTIGYA